MSQYDDLYEMDTEQKPKRKRHEDPTTWGDAWKAIGLFYAIALIVSIGFNLIQQTLFADKMQAYIDINLSVAGLQSGEASELFGSYFELFQNPAFVIIYIAVALLLSVAMLFLVYGALHVVTTKLFGGEGMLRGLIVRSNKWMIGTYVAYSIFTGIWSMFMISAVVARYEGVNILESSATMNDYTQFIWTQNGLMYLVATVCWIVWGVGVSRATANNYFIKTSKGCLSVIVSNIALLVVACGCLFAIGFGVGGVMATML